MLFSIVYVKHSLDTLIKAARAPATMESSTYWSSQYALYKCIYIYIIYTYIIMVSINLRKIQLKVSENVFFLTLGYVSHKVMDFIITYTYIIYTYTHICIFRILMGKTLYWRCFNNYKFNFLNIPNPIICLWEKNIYIQIIMVLIVFKI